MRLYAAGCLRALMTELGDVFAQPAGTPVKGEFGASGLMRGRIEKGEPAEVFASADMGHPQALSQAGRAGAVTLFARYRPLGRAAVSAMRRAPHEGQSPKNYFTL